MWCGAAPRGPAAAAKGVKLLAQILSHPFHAWLRDLCAHA